ncbi:serine hydrolase [Rhodobacterales bacterium]|nr:serine hydrolase [Rhodobacterales bacterium]
MTSASLTRRLLLGTASSALMLLPFRSFAQDLPPAETPGVEVPEGQIAEAVAKLDDIVERIKAESSVPGIAVAVVHKGETVYAKGFGVRKVGADAAITPDTVFQLASVSKSIGSTVVASQVGKGVVSWNSRMRDLLPWFTLSDPDVTAQLTIGDLYSHRSGLPSHAGDDLEDLGFGRQTVLERLRLLPLAPFRISYAYTNFGITAAAEAVARTAGSDWATLSEEVIYKPLGMASTSSRFADFMAAENRAIPHARDTDGSYQPLFQRQTDGQSPAGGVSSTINDMAVWMKMALAMGHHEDTQVVAPKALLPALSPQAFSDPPHNADSRPGFYGFGFNVGIEPSGRVKISHSGAFMMGTGTCFSLIPSLDLGIVVLTNAAPVGAAESIAASFTDLAQLGRETRNWYSGYSRLFEPFYTIRGRTVGQDAPAAAVPPPPAKDVVGRYANPYFGTVEIREEDGGLVLAAGPEPILFPLQPWDGPVMTFDFVNENAPLGSRSTLTFEGAANGPAQSLEIELFSEKSPSRFERV